MQASSLYSDIKSSIRPSSTHLFLWWLAMHYYLRLPTLALCFNALVAGWGGILWLVLFGQLCILHSFFYHGSLSEAAICSKGFSVFILLQSSLPIAVYPLNMKITFPSIVHIVVAGLELAQYKTSQINLKCRQLLSDLVCLTLGHFHISYTIDKDPWNVCLYWIN